jgi:hypothetical protein
VRKGALIRALEASGKRPFSGRIKTNLFGAFAGSDKKIPFQDVLQKEKTVLLRTSWEVKIHFIRMQEEWQKRPCLGPHTKRENDII